MSTKSRPSLSNFRKRLSGRKPKDDESGQKEPLSPESPGKRRGHSLIPPKSPKGNTNRRSHSVETNGVKSNENVDPTDTPLQAAAPAPRRNVFQKLRDRSRSRSRSRSTLSLDDKGERRKEMLVAVTSCRSDGYYNDKAPGSTSKLPRKAPTNLKLFHELAVGVKDAYAALGARPRKPTEKDKASMSSYEYEANLILWNFVGNLDFVSTKRETDYFVVLLTNTNHPSLPC